MLHHSSSWEPRPDNTTANHRVPTAQQIADPDPWGPSIGLDPKADTLRKQITGNFTGTTSIPHIDWIEPLHLEREDFANAIRTGTQPRANGRVGLEVVRIL